MKINHLFLIFSAIFVASCGGGGGSGSDSGHARIYDWDSSAWTQRGSDIDGEAAGDHSGIQVDISDDGNTLAIGARRNDGNGENAGHVRIYDWN